MDKSKTILIIGSKGQLGLSFSSIESLYSDYEFFYANRQDLDLEDEHSITSFFNIKMIFNMFKNSLFHIITEQVL